MPDKTHLKKNEFSCPLCAAAAPRPVFEMRAVPVYCNVLLPTKESALNCNRGDIELGICENCGFVSNMAFDPDLLCYTQDYENSLHFSQRFQQYADALAKDLVRRYGLQNRDIVEIGCGQGDFLASLCNIGKNRGVGFDPSYIPSADGRKGDGLFRVIPDLYSERYTELAADFLCCRQTLEHIPKPKPFLAALGRALGNRSVPVFFEVPNGSYTFRELFLWDIIYEHPHYFTRLSLNQAFSLCGFSVQEVTEEFEGQFLCIHALWGSADAQKRKGIPTDEIRQALSAAGSFSRSYRQRVDEWQRRMGSLRESGNKTVIWGSGSKGVTFLNILGRESGIEYAVDINPRKHGKYLPGTGQQIVSPQDLQSYAPDTIIGMNPVYREEIFGMVKELGLSAQLEFI
jgi:hypothetical protein